MRKKRLTTRAKKQSGTLAQMSKERRVKAGYRLEQVNGSLQGVDPKAKPASFRIEFWKADPDFRLEKFTYTWYPGEFRAKDAYWIVAERVAKWIDKHVPLKDVSEHEKAQSTDPFENTPPYEAEKEDIPF